MLQSFWKSFLDEYSAHHADNSILDSIIRAVEPVEISANTITLACESAGSKIFLQTRKKQIEDILCSIAGSPMEAVFIIQTKKQPKKKDEPLLSFQPTQEDMITKAGLSLKYKFDTFAVSSTNQVAFAAAQSIVKSPGTAYNPLFLHGGVGVGKTHLAQSIGRAILEQNPEERVFFCPGDQFTNELIESIRSKSTVKFRKKYRQLKVLIIDDIQFIAGKMSIQEEFFHTFNTIVSAGGQIILNSDRPPIEIKNLEDRLRSRFSGGLIVDVQPPDFELRTAILLIKAQEKGIMLDIDSAKLIAERVSDSRALEGTLLSIYATVLGKKEKIEQEDVENYLTQKTAKAQKKITPTEVIKTVCSFYEIRQSQIKSPTRLSNIALARQIIMYILREEYGIKLEEVARILKRKDHTTVIHGANKIKREMMKNPNLREDVERIVSSLHAST